MQLVHATDPMPQAAPIDVIVPAYRGLQETRACLESVLGAPVGCRFELVVIDDASPEPELSAYLDQLQAGQRITLLRNESNLGFVRSVNRGMALHPGRDVVLLNSDTVVANDWLDRLQRCAYSDPRIATVTPFSNNATICSYPVFCADNALPAGFGAAELDRVFRRVNRAKRISIPTAVGFCMFIRRASLDQLGLFDAERFGMGYGEENDFSRRAAAAGWDNVLCADTFVYHAGSVSFGAGRGEHQARGGAALLQLHPDYDAVVHAFIAADPVKQLRRAVDAALAGAEPALQHKTNTKMTVEQPAKHRPVWIFAEHELPADLERTLQAVRRNSVCCSKIVIAVAAAGLEPLRQRMSGVDEEGAIPVEFRAAAGLRDMLEADPDAGGDGAFALRAGVLVPPAWDARLAKVAQAEPRAATVSPLCAEAPAFSPLSAAPARALSEQDALRLDRLLYCLGARSYFAVDHPLAECLYLSLAALREAAALAKRAAPDAGALQWPVRSGMHLCADDVCVHLARASGRPALEHAEAPHVPAHLEQIQKAITSPYEAGADFAALPGLDRKPVQLHVTHDLGGGAIQWLRDFSHADGERINLVLKPYSRSHALGEGVALYAHVDDSRPLRCWRFEHPIQATAAAHLEYHAALQQIIQDYCVEAVLVSSLIGHSLDVMDTGLPTVVVGHDYYPYCSAINLYFKGVCSSCSDERLAECHQHNKDFNPFLSFPYEERLQVRRRYLALLAARDIVFAVPTRSVQHNLERLNDKFRNIRFELIPHGSEAAMPPLQLPAPAPDEKLRVLVLGQLSLGKGSALLLEVIERLTEFAEVYLIGTGEVGELFRNMPGVHPVSSYRRDELPVILGHVRPDLGLMLSIVPETFSFTLSELAQFRVPLVATNVGSFRERIEHGVTGYLFEPNAESLLSTLAAINADKEQLIAMRARMGGVATRTGADMVADYHRLLPVQAAGYARYPLQPQRADSGGTLRDELALSQALMLSESWKEIKKLNLMLTLKEEVLRRGESKEADAELRLEQKLRRLDRTERDLSDVSHRFEETAQQLAQARGQLAERVHAFDLQAQQLAEAQQVIRDQFGGLQHQKRLIDEKERGLRERDAELRERDAELRRHGERIAAMNESLERTQAELAHSNQQLREQDGHLGHFQRLLAEKTGQLAERERIIGSKDAQLAEIYASTSWKVSRPVRWVGFGIRKMKILAHCLWKPVICNPRHAPAILAELYRVWRRSGMLALKLHLVALPDIGKTRMAFGSATQEFALTIRSEVANRIAHMTAQPLISILMPTYNTPEPMLRETIQSVIDQLYPKWELCIADDCSTQPHVKEVLRQYAARDSRIKLHFDKENKGVSCASNQALKLAKGEFAVLLDHDDALEPQAIFRVAECVLAEQPDMLYSDEVIVAEDGTTVLGYAFRPAFSPELLRAHPYIVHLVGFRTSLLRELGGFDEDLKISQDYDLILRATERSHTVAHIPEILYRWRTHKQSAGHQKMAQVMEASKAILRRHLQRCGDKGTVQDGPSFNFFDTRYPMEPGAKVAIIIPTKNHGALVRQCIDSIERTVSRVPYDIVLIDHESTDPESVAYFESLKPRVKVLRYVGPFNFSSINNWAVKQLTGWYSHYLLCNNDIEAIKPGWLEHMVELCQRPSVGAVGPMLFYPDGKTIQHAGVCVGAYGAAEHYGKFIKLPDQGLEPGYLGSLIVTREVSCVTAACMLIRKEVFEEIEGFDEKLAVGFGDVDLCLKVIARGHRILFCPGEALIHHESVTRGKSTEDPHPEDSAYFVRKWKKFLADGDPYFNPNLSLFSVAWHVKVPMTHELAVKRRVCKLDRKHERQDVIVANSAIG